MLRRGPGGHLVHPLPAAGISLAAASVHAQSHCLPSREGSHSYLSHSHLTQRGGCRLSQQLLPLISI